MVVGNRLAAVVVGNRLAAVVVELRGQVRQHLARQTDLAALALALASAVFLNVLSCGASFECVYRLGVLLWAGWLAGWLIGSACDGTCAGARYGGATFSVKLP
eukprot:COSAG06_NODE_32001_length_512_cov_11.036320_2_plen_102_part_01